MQKLTSIFNLNATPQSEPVPGKNMVENNAGGFGFQLDQWGYLDRFLILGTEGGTYYCSEQKLTREACTNVLKCIADDGARTVARIIEISDSGRAAKNDPAIFALALCVTVGDQNVKYLAYRALPQVCRIGTHLFHFMKFVKEMDGPCGKGFQRAIQRWYTERPVKDVAYQAVKYQQRDGWSHRDVLRLVRPLAMDELQQDLFKYIVKGAPEDIGSVDAVSEELRIVWAVEQLKRTTDIKAAAKLIADYRLPHECVPNELKSNPEIWTALLQGMKPEAMLRNLNKLTIVGLVQDMGSETTTLIMDTFRDQEKLRRARLHPMKILMALRTYAAGHGFLGHQTWTVSRRVVDVLNDAFYLSFGNVTPTGKRICLALDVSGSMGSPIAGQPGLSCMEGAFAMALVTANVEENYEVMAFSDRFMKLPISPKQRLDSIMRQYGDMSFGGTDCSLPIIWAQQNNKQVDAFCVYTDNETWAGRQHPFQALKSYRKHSGIPAKSVVIGMSAIPFTIADPSDGGMLDVVGFDTATPELISNFIAG